MKPSALPAYDMLRHALITLSRAIRHLSAPGPWAKEDLSMALGLVQTAVYELTQAETALYNSAYYDET